VKYSLSAGDTVAGSLHNEEKNECYFRSVLDALYGAQRISQ